MLVPKNMSWLSPKRRRTTGNLKAIPNAQVNGDATSTSTNGSAPTSPLSQRPSTTHRPFTQPVITSVKPSDDGNLFYAYARKVILANEGVVGVSIADCLLRMDREMISNHDTFSRSHQPP